MAKATGVVGIVTLLSRVLGMLRDMMIANYFGAGFATDAFFTAFKIPNLLRRLVAEGSLSTAFVPIISDEIEKGPAAVRQAIRSTAGFCLVLTLSLTVLGMFFARELTLVFALGWSEQPEKLQLSTELLQIMFPYVVLISLTALSAGALNAMGYFGWAAASPALLNVSFIVVVYFFSPSMAEPIFSLPIGLLLGGILGLVPLVVSLWRMGFPLIPSSPFHSGTVRRLTRLMIPAIISSSVYQIMVFLNSILVTMLEEGAPSWLYFADRLFQFPLGVFSIAVATAVLPPLSRLATQGNDFEFATLLSKTLAWVTFITIPASLGLSLLSLEIVEVIYQNGAFTAKDALNTAHSLVGFSIGLWSLSTHTVLVRAFLAKKNSKTPAQVAVLSIASNMLLALLLMGAPLHPDANVGTRLMSSLQSFLPDFALGHVGLAIAGSLASLVSMFALGLLLPKIKIRLHWSMLLPSILRTTLAAAAMSTAILFSKSTCAAWFDPIGTLVSLISVGLLSFFLASVALRAEELKFMQALIKKRLG